ncbi:hypothetical protein FACS189451_10640 [Bacteroidia bacterium]|nr:hypothetical protein FACS189451_10640 [Bacteroidia bacterium]
MNIQTKIKERLSDFVDWIEYGLRRLYGKPTLMKQFIIVLILGSLLSVFSIYTLVSSIYNMGRHSAEQKFMELQHIETLQLQQKNDSINLLKQKMYEYEQSIE